MSDSDKATINHLFQQNAIQVNLCTLLVFKGSGLKLCGVVLVSVAEHIVLCSTYAQPIAA